MALKIKQNPMQFGGQLGGILLLVIFLVISLVLTILYTREGDEGPLHSLQAGTSAISTPFAIVSTSLNNVEDSASSSVADLTASDATMTKLRENNQKLTQMVAELEEYRQEAQRLEGLLSLHDTFGIDGVSGHVIGLSTDSYNQVITIDQGASQGAKVGLPVISDTGVIGQIISVTEFTSQVRLITDAQSGVSVLVQSSRAEGIVVGSVEGVLYLEDIASDAQVQVGDVVITSGLGGGYNRGLVLGTVARIEQKQGDAARTIVVTPNAQLDKITEVMIVKGMSTDGAASSDNAKAAAAIVAAQQASQQASGTDEAAAAAAQAQAQAAAEKAAAEKAAAEKAAADAAAAEESYESDYSDYSYDEDSSSDYSEEEY